MNMFATINGFLKQMGALYVDLFGEIIKMIKINTKKYLRAVGIGCGIFLGCALAIGIAMIIMGTHNKYIFSTANWNKYPSDRINMIDSMESQYNFVGMSQNEIEGILGKPSYTTKKSQCEYIALNKVDYDNVAQYELNKESRSLLDMIDKNYVIAYKNNKVVYAKALIAD